MAKASPCGLAVAFALGLISGGAWAQDAAADPA